MKGSVVKIKSGLKMFYILFVFTVLFLPLKAIAENWQQVYQDELELYFVDTDSITTDNNLADVWVKVTCTDQALEGDNKCLLRGLKEKLLDKEQFEKLKESISSIPLTESNKEILNTLNEACSISKDELEAKGFANELDCLGVCPFMCKEQKFYYVFDLSKKDFLTLNEDFYNSFKEDEIREITQKEDSYMPISDLIPSTEKIFKFTSDTLKKKHVNKIVFLVSLLILILLLINIVVFFVLKKKL